MNVLQELTPLTVLWPSLLWLLAPLALLVIVYLRLDARQRRAYARLSGLSLSGASASRLRRTLPPLLFLVGLAALVVSIARPQAEMTLPSRHRDVILAIDISGSMRATDIKPDRLGAAQAAARAFIERQPPNSRIGIVSVAGSAALVQSLTDNREELLQAIGRLQLQRGTALGSGLYVALAALLPDAKIDLEQIAYARSGANPAFANERPVRPGANSSAAIVLLTDGESNHGPDLQQAARFAASHGVRVYTVGIGSRDGITLGFSGWSMRVRLDEEALRTVANTTLGDYYAATSAQELSGIYERLSTRMVIERSRSVEVTAFFVAVGALLLVVSAFCSVLWFNRVL